MEDKNLFEIKKGAKTEWNKLGRYQFYILSEHSELDVSQEGLTKVGFATAASNLEQAKFALGGQIQGKKIVLKKVQLAIPPQSIDIQVSFASNVFATNGGVVEENNGIVFKTITISGNTGFLIQGMDKKDFFGKLANIAGLIAPKAAQGVSNLVSKVTKAWAGLAGSTRTPVVTTNGTEESTSGHYQFIELHNLFTLYSSRKTKKTTSDDKLVFAISKENAGYICSPISFSYRKDKNNPLVWNYNIVLKAWDQTTSTAFEIPTLNVPTPRNTAALKIVSNLLTNARSLIEESRNTVKAIQSDIDDVVDLSRQAALLVKSTAGLVYDIRDFSNVINTDNDDIFSGALWANINGVWFTATKTDKKEIALKSNPNLSSKFSFIALDGSKNEVDKNSNNNSAIVKKVLEDPTLSAKVDVDSASDKMKALFDDEVKKAKELKTSDVKELAAKLQETSNNYASSVGLSDAQYNKSTGTTGPDKGRSANEDDIITMAAIQDAKEAAISLLATGEIMGQRDPDPILNANAFLSADDQITEANSTFVVPWESGATLEDMAFKYLGDSNRAKDIAVINGLRAPYIDEVGFEISILSADLRYLVINKTDQLAINQKVTIKGTGLKSTNRTIIAINDIGGQLELTLDGNADLDLYIPSSNPKIKARTLGTVGVGDYILIPSETLPDLNTIAERPTALNQKLSATEKLFKTDIKLKDNNDLSFSPSGDAEKASGYDNAHQAIKAIIETETNELEQHRGFGLAPVGDKALIENINAVKANIESQILADPRFKSVNVNITVDGSVIRVDVVAQGQAGNSLIPVSFRIGEAN